MGKRRIRCLKALGHESIVGLDPKPERRQDASDTYGVKTVASAAEIDPAGIDAVIVSTPPDLHNPYLKLAMEWRKPVFVEASVILDGLEEIDAASREFGVPLAPSCTFRFHTAIRDITRIVHSGEYGKITNFSYHSGQYLPDWHPWEDIRDFYVSKKETGACREIVPFELTWLLDVVGFPTSASGTMAKTFDLGVDIDDTYAIVLNYPRAVGTMVVDAVARSAVRQLVLNMERAQISWRWDTPQVNLYEADTRRTVVFHQPPAPAAAGYNANISERMYIEEIRAFLEFAKGGKAFPNTMQDDIRVLRLLHEIEARAAKVGP